MYPPKFLIARKVMKDIIMDLSKVRSGIAHFGSPGADRTNQQFEDLKPTCDHPDSSFDSMRKTYMDTIDRFRFGSGTPLARALLDVGQYYHSADLPWWNLGTTWNGSSNANQSSICFACQNSSIIVVTDGLPKASDAGGIPRGTVTAAQMDSLYAGDTSTGITKDSSGSGGIPTSLCPSCNDFPFAEDWKNDPTRVAWYLHNMDLRKNGETTLDCQGNGGKQTVNVYTVGFGTQFLPSANTLLQNTAAMGGGFFVGAENAPLLKSGITSILEDINTRSTSFSVATVSTLQTTAGHSVIIPRFSPAKSAHWRGQLYRHELYSEFLNPCIETPDGTGAGDLDCDGRCQSVFLMDSDGDFIQEDADGILRKNDPPDQVSCIQAPRCEAAGRACAAPGTASANAWWDAQVPLSQAAWTTRKVYTVVDTTGDGKVDSADYVFQLDTSDDTAARIAPYMPLGNGGVCDAIATKVAGAGDATTAAAIRASQEFCVKTIVRYVLGADVFNEKGAKLGTTWPRPATDAGQDTLPDRDFKLGDIFHSSPVVMDPPPPPDGVLCPNGLHNQCLTSLWQTPVPSDPPDTNAYGVYAKSGTYKDRRKVVLVGANDGMLHAFDGGTWHAGARDEFTWEHTGHQVDTSKAPYNGYYDRGTGRELWAFVPPDQLAKLPLFLGAAHQLYVDGSPMVRDVWVDGSHNALNPSASVSAKDGKKQPWEFHTVALMGERRGGTHYFALDMTDATRLPEESGYTKPKFLWIYPQPNSADSLRTGETYNDFLPIGPPIGPVRLESTAADAPTMVVPGAAAPVPYEERWVAFLSGGYDPQYVRGRGVYMVDVWTGNKVWDFAYPASSAAATPGDVRLNLNAPVPATVGMVMWGSSERRRRQIENDGYFDTATFGDAAGQLWVLRFARPGPTGWTGARVLEMPGCTNQPFFYLTANVPVSGGIYRVLAGTGDRFNLLDTGGGVCGPDNIRACVQRGCTVRVSGTSSTGTPYNQFSAPGLGSITTGLAAGATCVATNSSATGANTGCDLFGGARIEISGCPSPDPSNSATSTTKDFRMTCTDTATGYSCTYVGAQTPGEKLSLSNSRNPITQRNWFFSLRVFEDGGDRMIFWDEAAARRYDAARLAVSSPTSVSAGITVIDGAVDAPTTLSSAAATGWAMYYNHGPSVTVADHTYPVNALDERTSSTSAVYGGIFWNATQPASGTSSRTNTSGKCPNVALCTMENRRISYHYGADPTTGGPVMYDFSGVPVRSTKNTTLVPTMGDQPTVFVNQKGQVQVGLTAVNPEKGATNVNQGGTIDPAPGFGLVEMSRETHGCRHAGDATAAAAACPK
jgi:type IV pilus assembly protein PilY1